MARTFERYGQTWNAGLPDLKVELEAIRFGGKWTYKGKECGLGLFQHFMNARKLAWPHRYHHRWVELVYKEIIQNLMTVLMGPFSCGKTSLACEFILLDYWANPDDTMVLCSTTSTDKLNSGVFSEVKMLFKEAQERYPWVDGNPIEHKHAITTDLLGVDTDMREMRKGIFGKACYVGAKYVGLGVFAGLKQKRIRFLADECFPAGTLVDTPTGSVPIEKINPGDKVLNCTGVDTVIGVKESKATKLCKITMQDGTEIKCTKNHEFLTKDGWKKAIDIYRGQYILSTYEILQVLSDRNSGLQTFSSKDVLQQVLFLQMAHSSTGVSGKVLHEGTWGKNIKGEIAVELGSSRIRGYAVEANEGKQSDGWCFTKRNGESAYCKGREWNRTNGIRVNNFETFGKGKSSVEFSSENKNGQEIWLSSLFQNRHCDTGIETCGGSGWVKPQQSDCTGTGFEKTKLPVCSWVESCEIYEPSSEEANGSSGDGITVYNLHVKNNHTYSVHGLTVKNCQFMPTTFFDCLPNMMGSVALDKFNDPQIKVIACGNPKHDPFDQLGRAAEPENGWDSVGIVEKTTVWNTKFHKGRCVNLIGTDSPNFDVPEGEPVPFPRLINRYTIRAVEKTWDKNSLKFNEQCIGRMMIGMAGNRVLTKTLCQNNQAYDKPVWIGTKRTRIGAVDPSWSEHGDRCLWAWGEFGEGQDGNDLFSIEGYAIIPIIGGVRDEPDDQIAKYVQARCKELNIEPDNVFYGSTGRGTTGAAFAKVFGHICPVPIAEGGKASLRPVREDYYINGENGERRHKRCDEEYSKFITELWFAVRSIVECGQMRGITDEIVDEASARKYDLVSGGRIELEPKDDFKERLGFSPDLFDCICFLAEGARQRGIKIKKLGATVVVDKDEEDFFKKEAEEWRGKIKEQMLKR